MKQFCLVLLSAIFIASCATGPERELYQSGIASWYGNKFHGRRTASGEIFNMNSMTAAHPSLPFGTWILVESPVTRKSVQVRINDRGPFAQNRILDLSYAAAAKLGIVQLGEAEVAIYVKRRHKN